MPVLHGAPPQRAGGWVQLRTAQGCPGVEGARLYLRAAAAPLPPLLACWPDMLLSQPVGGASMRHAPVTRCVRWCVWVSSSHAWHDGGSACRTDPLWWCPSPTLGTWALRPAAQSPAAADTETARWRGSQCLLLLACASDNVWNPILLSVLCWSRGSSWATSQEATSYSPCIPWACTCGACRPGTMHVLRTVAMGRDSGSGPCCKRSWPCTPAPQNLAIRLSRTILLAPPSPHRSCSSRPAPSRLGAATSMLIG